MREPDLDRFSIRFADEWQPRPWPSKSIREPQEDERADAKEQEQEEHHEQQQRRKLTDKLIREQRGEFD